MRLMNRGLAILVALGMLVTAVPAMAAYHDDKPIDLGPSKRESYHEYGIVAASDTAGATLHPEDCKIAPESAPCDTIPLLLDIPSVDYLHKITITLTWDPGADAGSRAGQTAYSNDLDMFLYATQITTTVWKGKRTRQKAAGSPEPIPDGGLMAPGCTYNEGNDTSTCNATTWPSQGSAATASHPETARLADMPPIGEVYPQIVSPAERNSGVISKQIRFTEYSIVIHAFSGASDYQMKGTFTPVTFDFDRPRSGFFQRFFGGDNGSSSSRGSSPLGGGTGAGSSGAELEPVKEPGADGPLTEHDLFAIKGQGAEDSGGLNPIIPVAIAIVLLGGGLAGFFFIRSRRRTSEA